jgi:hypothetical protein
VTTVHTITAALTATGAHHPDLANIEGRSDHSGRGVDMLGEVEPDQFGEMCSGSIEWLDGP